MGTTRDALDAGSLQFAWVVAIEGYPRLLTNWHTPADVVTAFAGLSDGDFTDALGGLYVDLQNQQSISPWEPMHSGGTCTIHVAPDASDTFGVEVNRRAAGAQTELTATLDRSATTVSVKSTAAFASSGTVYVGTEAISYSAKTTTTLTGCVRGLCSPFPATGSETSRFAQYHRVGAGPDTVALAPVVSAQPRTWVGRWIGVWMVRVSGGVLDDYEEAQLVFAGKLAEIRDDVNSLATVLDCRHVLDVIREGSLGRQMGGAQAKEGIYLKQGMRFDIAEGSTTSGVLTETSTSPSEMLDVVASGATGDFEVNEGYYTLEQLLGVLNTWFNATSLDGSYSLVVEDTGDGWRAKFTQVLAGDITYVFFYMPKQVADLLGYDGTVDGNYRIAVTGTSTNGSITATGTKPVLSSVLFKYIAGQGGLNFEIENNFGEFVDQYDSMPAVLRPGSADLLGVTHSWGLFLFDGGTLMLGAWNPADSPTSPGELVACRALDNYFAFRGDLESYSVPYDGTSGRIIPIRQVLVYEARLFAMLASLLFSTGTDGYNESTYDALPFGSGLAIPGSLLADELVNSLRGLPGADESMTVVIDKPHTLGDLLQGDLVLRLAFPLWRDGHVRFNSWRTPSTAAAVATLAESNKAEPAGNVSSQRSGSTLTDQWQRQIVKIQYNRDFADLSNDGFRDSVTLEDRVAVDDAGGEGAVVTIKARNTFGQFEATGAAIESLIPGFLATMPLFSRPARQVTRSIDSRYFESLAVGDVVLFEDEFARDPETGLRGITARPALVVAHQWTPGGHVSPIEGDASPLPMAGSVTLFFTDKNATLSDALYAPAADVDHTYATGGYTAGYNSTTKTLRCVTRQYNQSTSETINGFPVLNEEDPDASCFLTGYKVKVVERDPADINNPQVWTDTVASQSGDDVTLTTGLAGFDTAKRYRLIFDDYDAVVTAQQLKAFQADDADGLIVDASGPFLYRSASAERKWVDNDDPPVIEMLPALAYADGAGRDVGYETALALMLDNLVDYKTGINQPVLFAERSNTANAGKWELVYLAPIWLGREIFSNTVTREYTVSVLHRSTDGTSASVRVSLCAARPVSASRLDVARGSVYAEYTATTTSTSYVAATSDLLDAAVKGDGGLVWLIVECGYKAATVGIRQLQEGPRSAPDGFIGVPL